MDWLRARRMGRIALRPRHWNTEHEDLALLDRAHTTQNFRTREKIETTAFVVGTPAAPILWKILEEFLHVHRFACHNSPQIYEEPAIRQTLVIYRLMIPAHRFHRDA